MHHLRSIEEAELTHESVVTIGVFDGVHRGHQHLIGKLVAHARQTNRIPVVLTFYPYPDLVIKGYEPGFYLTLPDAKAELLAGLGVEYVITHPFDDSVRTIRASTFLDTLLSRLHLASLWVGSDFAFGYQREGNIKFLADEAARGGFELRTIDLMDDGRGERVSSTQIRQALKDGAVELADDLLGRPHRISGDVVKGAGRGRTIGIPTANLNVSELQAVPSRGVYAAYAVVDEQRIPSVVNIGLRPTFEGQASQTIESHLLDYSHDLYDKLVSLDFTARLRDERKFDSVEALIAQIHSDIESARKMF